MYTLLNPQEVSMSDIVIHIDEDLEDGVIRSLEKDLAQVIGVTSACVNDRARHLMVIDYDPDDVHSQELLGCIQSHGIHAELIGL